MIAIDCSAAYPTLPLLVAGDAAAEESFSPDKGPGPPILLGRAGGGGFSVGVHPLLIDPQADSVRPVRDEFWNAVNNGSPGPVDTLFQGAGDGRRLRG